MGWLTRKIISSEAADWKAALSSVKGVYMLTDMNNGKRYIGSAYGDGGVWGRWHSYAYSLHGGNWKGVMLSRDERYGYNDN